MSDIPAELKYAATHEWARLEEDGTVTVGISDHAQSALGDVVYIEAPELGLTISAQEEAGVVESVKAASDVYSPVTGTIAAVNTELADKPETINEDAYGEGWIFVVDIDDPDQLNDMLDPDAYAELLEEDD